MNGIVLIIFVLDIMIILIRSLILTRLFFTLRGFHSGHGKPITRFFQPDLIKGGSLRELDELKPLQVEYYFLWLEYLFLMDKSLTILGI